MALLDSHRYLPGDLEDWERSARMDALLAQSPRLAKKEERAIKVIRDFFANDSTGYLGVSWGKDSVVTAHLVWRAMGDEVPVVWVKIDPLYNPDCELVRDVFLDRFDIGYYEFEVPWRQGQEDLWRQLAQSGSTSSLGYSPPESAAAVGFRKAIKWFGNRHVSGVRGQESNIRHFRMAKYGENSPNTCAPIGWWSTADVFAYLHKHGLPVHPAYAMSMGGTLDRERLRVDAFGGGKGSHRARWEAVYYPDRMEFIKNRALSDQ